MKTKFFNYIILGLATLLVLVMISCDEGGNTSVNSGGPTTTTDSDLYFYTDATGKTPAYPYGWTFYATYRDNEIDTLTPTEPTGGANSTPVYFQLVGAGTAGKWAAGGWGLPANNTTDVLDATIYESLNFWARSTPTANLGAASQATTIEWKLEDRNPNPANGTAITKTITTTWTEYSIPLSQFSGTGKEDLTDIKAIAYVLPLATNGEATTAVDIDEIRLVLKATQ